MSLRPIKRLVQAKPTLEGAGVHLRRAFGFRNTSDFDPFLLLDDFRNDIPANKLEGFPWYPHRGIETITSVLAGTVEDDHNLGNCGAIAGGEEPRRGPIMTAALWIVQGLLAALFLWAGGIKLVLPLEQLTGPMPIPLPGLTPLAASGLVIIMIGATVVTLAGGDVASALIPLVVGLLAGFVAYGRWRLTPLRGSSPPPAARSAGSLQSRPSPLRPRLFPLLIAQP